MMILEDLSNTNCYMSSTVCPSQFNHETTNGYLSGLDLSLTYQGAVCRNLDLNNPELEKTLVTA